MERRGGGILLPLHDVSGGEVVGDGVAGHVIEGALHRHVFRGLADHGGQLDLPVHHLREERELDLRAGADNRSLRRLDEMPGPLPQLLHRRSRRLAGGARHLGHVIGVVGSRAEDGARVEYGREQPDALEGHPLRPALARGQVLGRLSEQASGSVPVLEHAEHARVGGGARHLGGVVDGLAHEHTRTRASAVLIAQQFVGHRVPP